jgi:hypothetical protein
MAGKKKQVEETSRLLFSLPGSMALAFGPYRRLTTIDKGIRIAEALGVERGGKPISCATA